MRWITIVQHVIALFSRMYLGIVVSLVAWATLPILIGWTPTVVMSGSMQPNIMVGDVLVAQKLSPEQKKDIFVGQVLLANDPSQPDKLFTHRVVNAIKGEGFITKGDANLKADSAMVPISSVQGLERLRIPLIGLPIQSMRTGNHIPLILFVGLTIFAQLYVNFHSRKYLNKNAVGVRAKHKRHACKEGFLTRTRLLGILSLTAAYSAVSTVTASSAANFLGSTSNIGNTFATAASFSNMSYKDAILANAPYAYYQLNDSSGIAVDSSGNNRNARYSSTDVTTNVPGALMKESSNKAVALNEKQGAGQTDGKGSGAQGSIVNETLIPGPQNLTLQIWFKTVSQRGGKLIGFTSSASGTTDRVLYLSSNGRVIFGIDSATKTAISTPGSYNDGNWHRATATLSGLDAALYIDGNLVSYGKTTSTPSIANGYWTIGGESFSGWSQQPSISFLSGSIDEVAIYTRSLTANQIASSYNAAW
jgi:signal peptidase I